VQLPHQRLCQKSTPKSVSPLASSSRDLFQNFWPGRLIATEIGARWLGDRKLDDGMVASVDVFLILVVACFRLNMVPVLSRDWNSSLSETTQHEAAIRRDQFFLILAIGVNGSFG
jgi:hypothetical protein